MNLGNILSGFNIGNFEALTKPFDKAVQSLGISLGSFGDIVFQANGIRTMTYQDFSRTTAARFVEHEVIGRKPVLEFIGLENDSVSFRMKLNASLGVNPAKEIKRVREILASGEAQPLIFNGTPYGNFVLQSMSDQWAYVDNWGNVIVATMTLQLKESN